MSLFLPRYLLITLFFLGALAGCGDRATLSELPPVPQVDTQRYLRVIQEQIDVAIGQVEKFPGKAATNGNLGKLLYTYEQYESASIMFDRAGLLETKEFRWPYLSGRAKAELGQTDAAEQSLLRALERRPDYGPINVQLAELYLKASRDEEARTAVERALISDPDRPEAHFILAKLAARNGEAEQTIKHLERVEQLSGNFGALHYLYSQAYRQLGDHEEADVHLASYEQFKDVTANVVDLVMGNVLEMNISVNQLVTRAKRLVVGGNNAAALKLLEQAVENDPDSLAAHVTLIGVYSSNQRFAEADQHIAAATAIDPDHSKLHYAIGVARMIEQRITEATRAFERSLSIDPRNADTNVQLGMLLEQQQREGEAISKYEMALSQAPVNRVAHWRLGRLLLNRGDASGSLKHLESIREQVDPATPEILLDLARAYAAETRVDEAIATLEQSMELAQRFDNVPATNKARGLIKTYRQQQERSNAP